MLLKHTGIFLSIRERGRTRKVKEERKAWVGDWNSSMGVESPLRFFSWAMGSLLKW